MRATRRRRPHPRRQTTADGVDLAELAKRARYVGSPEHKSYLSPAGTPKLRSDASPCPKDLAAFDELTDWLQDAISNGAIGAPWEGDFPRYAWVERDGFCFEARLVNRETGEYKGYPLRNDERPDWIIGT